MLSLLLQPLTGDDVVKILTVMFAGIAAVIYAWRGPSTGKTDLASQLAAIHNAMNNLLLSATPPGTTTKTETTTEGDPTVKQTVTTTQGPVNQALTDTLPLDGTPLPKKVTP